LAQVRSQDPTTCSSCSIFHCSYISETMRRTAVALVLACLTHTRLGRRLERSAKDVLIHHSTERQDMEMVVNTTGSQQRLLPIKQFAPVMRAGLAGAQATRQSPERRSKAHHPVSPVGRQREKAVIPGVASRASGMIMRAEVPLEPKPWETGAMSIRDYPSGSYQDLLDGMAVCRNQSKVVLPIFDELMQHDFFSLFPFDLFSSCRMMPTEQQSCDMSTCEIDIVDEVPYNLAVRDANEYDFRLDAWVLEDPPSELTEYYDLRRATKRYTGYNGSRVWRFIHNKIDFQEGLDEPENGWKRDFNRAVSGIHAAVDCDIIADIGLNEEGLQEYHRRLRDEPGSIGNLYFTYMLVLEAIRDMRERLDTCDYIGDKEVQPIMRSLTGSELIQAEPIQRAARKIREHVNRPDALPQVWQARMRTRFLFSCMSCVQCNVCQLHGKVTVLGLATTFQLLLGSTGYGDDPRDLDRKQVAALIATADKLAHACAVVEQFRELDGDDTSSVFETRDRAEAAE